MPEGSKPSDLIGGFHGSTETAEIDGEAGNRQPSTSGRMADAKTAAPSQLADGGRSSSASSRRRLHSRLRHRKPPRRSRTPPVLASPLVTLFMGDTREAREIRATMQAACAEAARIRAEMTRIQAEAARQGSALMQRTRSGRRSPY